MLSDTLGGERTESGRVKLDLALVHYPVGNKKGDTIGSAITNLDLHDIARAGRTYGIDAFYVITPYADQQQLAREIIAHWLTGYGAGYNRLRKEALGLIRICDDLAGLYAEVNAKWQKKPTILATSARQQENTLSYQLVRQRLGQGEPFLLLFGTGWGLTPEVMDKVDGVLPPIEGSREYNHLSVRAAVAITLDRLLGEKRE